jgi:hypothetical protein
LPDGTRSGDLHPSLGFRWQGSSLCALSSCRRERCLDRYLRRSRGRTTRSVAAPVTRRGLTDEMAEALAASRAPPRTDGPESRARRARKSSARDDGPENRLDAVRQCRAATTWRSPCQAGHLDRTVRISPNPPSQADSAAAYLQPWQRAHRQGPG